MWATLGVLVVVCSGMGWPLAKGQATGVRPPPDTPPAARVDSALSVIGQTAAIVEATVQRIGTEFADTTGPWTRVELKDVVVHRGKALATSLVHVGGSYPDGTKLSVSHVPTFAEGERYLLFLRNTSWYLSPIVGSYAFRLVKEDGKELLISAEGSAVIRFDLEGAVLSDRIFETHDLWKGPVRLVDRGAPEHAFGVQALLREVDRHAKALGSSIGGTFYGEPPSRAFPSRVAVSSDGASLTSVPVPAGEDHMPSLEQLH